MRAPTLEEVIRQHISLPHVSSAKGFYPILCKVCNDHGRKGPRAGFKFEGDVVGYNCFNCGHTAKYDPSKHRQLSDNMITVLEAFGISEIEYNKIMLGSLQHQFTPFTPPKKNIEPKIIHLPNHFYPLGQAHENNEIAKRARKHLTHRKIDPQSYTFYLSYGGTIHDNKWLGRLIIPVYKSQFLIFYLGRDLLGSRKKYLNPMLERDKILFGFEHLFSHIDTPLYVVEGFFDAFKINGVAVFGNKMTETQIEWLNRSPRQKVVIPDRKGDGHILAEQALSLDWSVATPDIGECKDVDEAITRYGKLYVIRAIVDQTHTGFFAKTAVRLYCEPPSRKNKRVR